MSGLDVEVGRGASLSVGRVNPDGLVTAYLDALFPLVGARHQTGLAVVIGCVDIQLTPFGNGLRIITGADAVPGNRVCPHTVNRDYTVLILHLGVAAPHRTLDFNPVVVRGHDLIQRGVSAGIVWAFAADVAHEDAQRVVHRDLNGGVADCGHVDLAQVPGFPTGLRRFPGPPAEREVAALAFNPRLGIEVAVAHQAAVAGLGIILEVVDPSGVVIAHDRTLRRHAGYYYQSQQQCQDKSNSYFLHLIYSPCSL